MRVQRYCVWLANKISFIFLVCVVGNANSESVAHIAQPVLLAEQRVELLVVGDGADQYWVAAGKGKRVKDVAKKVGILIHVVLQPCLEGRAQRSIVVSGNADENPSKLCGEAHLDQRINESPESFTPGRIVKSVVSIHCLFRLAKEM